MHPKRHFSESLLNHKKTPTVNNTLQKEMKQEVQSQKGREMTKRGTEIIEQSMIFKKFRPKFRVSIETLLDESKPLELEKYKTWQTSINCTFWHFGFPGNQNLDASKKNQS